MMSAGYKHASERVPKKSCFAFRNEERLSFLRPCLIDGDVFSILTVTEPDAILSHICSFSHDVSML